MTGTIIVNASILVSWPLFGRNAVRLILLGHAYAYPIRTLSGQEIVIGASWTRGLAIHPVGQSDLPPVSVHC